ncbi:hypothetical protein E2C01_084251 [Portunus trituberculatus]|uniref:Uncharacterized protein n=1 Tax=Portunus trituberculatus TaxID=210409 RepID=A0A5B7IUS9_PORTR|nr:hypothetical protein [Portunus trituberculatus]
MRHPWSAPPGEAISAGVIGRGAEGPLGRPRCRAEAGVAGEARGQACTRASENRKRCSQGEASASTSQPPGFMAAA